jgi:DNA-binding transcriptional MerR regulator
MTTIKLVRSQMPSLARQVGLTPEVVLYCREVGLVRETASEADLAELRRVRRLKALGVNLAGIEIILRMRRRLLQMQAEMDEVTKEMEEMQSEFELDMRRLRQQMARDI